MRHLILLLVLAAATASVQAAPRCTETVSSGSRSLQCSYMTRYVSSNYGVPRAVRYQVPDGIAPIGGWPAVVMYQPSLFPIFWSAQESTPAGAYYQVQLIKVLLERGYAVVEPPANPYRVGQYWDTNQPGMDSVQNYTTTDDHSFLSNVLKDIGAGKFGPINSARLYATGMSSGGYNTSRMAVSFAGKFRALAVQSAAYANCLGSSCTVPPVLPASHPPTIFLHGQQDGTVPVSTMLAYYNRLRSQGIGAKTVINPAAAHEYLSAAPQEIPAWFDQHR